MAFLFVGGRLLAPSQTQYAPSLQRHDPNPPMTLQRADTTITFQNYLFVRAASGMSVTEKIR